jgi:hypothetical protein
MVAHAAGNGPIEFGQQIAQPIPAARHGKRGPAHHHRVKLGDNIVFEQ